MNYQIFILFAIAPSLLLHATAKTLQPKAELKESANATSAPPKETSYFYRDPQGPGTYEFGYHIEDEKTGNTQFREEKRHPNGTITGSYGHVRQDGKLVVTNYIADEKGYRRIKKMPNRPSNSSSSSPSTESSVTTMSTISTTAATTTTMMTEIPGLNLTAGTLPPQLVEDVMNKYDIDLSPNASPGDILHPNISDIIEGKVPLSVDNKTSKLGFQVVHDFIPSNFPIVPFKLPQESTYDPVID